METGRGVEKVVGRMKQRMPRKSWSRPLSRPLVIPDVTTMVTLADVRVLIERHSPKAHREAEENWGR